MLGRHGQAAGLTFVAIALITLSLGTPGVQAGHADDSFEEEGHLAVGNPASSSVGGASEAHWVVTGEETLDGVDGEVVELPTWAPGHTVWVNGSSPAAYDLDVWFYDEERSFIGDGAAGPDEDPCVTPSADEVCEVPPEARYAVVDLWSGADVDVALTLLSVADDAGPGPAVHTIPQWAATWPKAHLDVVILPPVTGPVYDGSGEPFPSGKGLATDSPYVDATKDAMDAWRQAIDAYVAQNASASFLQNFTFDVGVVGEDRSMAEFRDADIRVMYGPTGLNALGVAVADETDGQQWQRCDVVNFQWLVFSFTLADMYNIHAQEFGHCLGLDHPSEPADDVMNGIYEAGVGDPDNQRLCHSSLDIHGLAGLYAWMGEDGEWEAPPSEVGMPADDYVTYGSALVAEDQSTCPNPGSGY